MKAGWTISAALHGAVLVWGLVTLATKPLSAPPPEFITTDIISATDFSQITNGIKTAPKAEAPKPLVERSRGKPVRSRPQGGDTSRRSRDRRSGAAAKSARAQEAERSRSRTAAKPSRRRPRQGPEPRSSIAEALKKDQENPSKTQKKADTPREGRADEPQPTSTRSRIAALLDSATRSASLDGETLVHTSLGTATGAPQLVQKSSSSTRAAARS